MSVFGTISSAKITELFPQNMSLKTKILIEIKLIENYFCLKNSFVYQITDKTIEVQKHCSNLKLKHFIRLRIKTFMN